MLLAVEGAVAYASFPINPRNVRIMVGTMIMPEKELKSSLIPKGVRAEVLFLVLTKNGSCGESIGESVYMQLLDGTFVQLDGNSSGLILQSLHKMSTSAVRCLGFPYKDGL